MGDEYKPFKYFPEKYKEVSEIDFSANQRMANTSVMATESLATTQSLDKSIVMFSHLENNASSANTVYQARSLAYSLGAISAALYHLMDCYSRIGQYALRKHEYLRKQNNAEEFNGKDSQEIDAICFWLNEWHLEANYNLLAVIKCINKSIRKQKIKFTLFGFVVGVCVGYFFF